MGGGEGGGGEGGGGRVGEDGENGKEALQNSAANRSRPLVCVAGAAFKIEIQLRLHTQEDVNLIKNFSTFDIKSTSLKGQCHETFTPEFFLFKLTHLLIGML